MDILKKILLVAICIVAFASLLRAFLHGTYPDFTVYFYGSRSFLTGNNPYITRPEYFSNYVYPPFVLLLFAPFVLLPLPLGSFIFELLSVFCLGAGIYFVLKTLDRLSLNSFLIAVSLSILAFPTKFTLGMGQVNLVIFLLIALSFYFFKTKKNLLSGSMLGLSFAIKFFPFLILIFLLIKKQRRIALVSVSIFILLCILATLITGFKLQVFYLEHVLSGVGDAYQKDYYNQALSGFFARLPLDTYTGKMLKVLSSVLFLLVTFVVAFIQKEWKDNSALGFSLFITLGLIINPFSWQHHFVWLILPFLVVYYATKSFSILLLVSYVLIAVNLPHPERIPLVLQSHVLFGTMLLWLLQIKLLLHKK